MRGSLASHCKAHASRASVILTARWLVQSNFVSFGNIFFSDYYFWKVWCIIVTIYDQTLQALKRPVSGNLSHLKASCKSKEMLDFIVTPRPGEDWLHQTQRSLGEHYGSVKTFNDLTLQNLSLTVKSFSKVAEHMAGMRLWLKFQRLANKSSLDVRNLSDVNCQTSFKSPFRKFYLSLPRPTTHQYVTGSTRPDLDLISGSPPCLGNVTA